MKFIAFHKSKNEIFELSSTSFADLCADIYGEMNIIAPYQKYYKLVARLSFLVRDKFNADTMTALRREAVELIESNKINTPEWVELYRGFYAR